MQFTNKSIGIFENFMIQSEKKNNMKDGKKSDEEDVSFSPEEYDQIYCINSSNRIGYYLNEMNKLIRMTTGDVIHLYGNHQNIDIFLKNRSNSNKVEHFENKLNIGINEYCSSNKKYASIYISNILNESEYNTKYLKMLTKTICNKIGDNSVVNDICLDIIKSCDKLLSKIEEVQSIISPDVKWIN